MHTAAIYVNEHT